MIPGSGRLGLVALLLGFLFSPRGDARGGEETLVIATEWPVAEREKLDSGFRRWVEARPSVGLVRIDWLALMPGDDLAQVARRRPPPDVLLGGAAIVYRTMAREERLESADRPETPAWCDSRCAPIGHLFNPKVRQPQAPPSPAGETKARALGLPHGAMIFDDPRHDPIALVWAKWQLSSGRFAEGYARLVYHAANPRRIGRAPGSARAVVERGEAAMTPAVAPIGSDFPRPLLMLPLGEPPEWVEGVAIVRGSAHRALAQEFLRFLDAQGQAASPPLRADDDDEFDGLIADLLGATLVDAQDELWSAWAALRKAGRPALVEAWMTELPPWPPASVATLLDRDKGLPLLDTLASELAPDADVRAWLVQSWLRPRRPLDGRLLADLDRAAGGRLVREPRFRAWLRAEWTAWARQRYARVAAHPDAPP